MLGVINMTEERWKSEDVEEDLFPLRKTSRIVVFVVYKLSKVRDEIEEKEERKKQPRVGDLKLYCTLFQFSLFFWLVSSSFFTDFLMVFAVIKNCCEC